MQMAVVMKLPSASTDEQDVEEPEMDDKANETISLEEQK